MRWNWQDPNWPNFRFRPAPLAEREGLFLRQNGVVVGTVRHVPDEERLPLIIELISTEALKTSEIEGEIPTHNRRLPQAPGTDASGVRTEEEDS
jgi:hypothetical protein